jgi:hypothetical protein
MQRPFDKDLVDSVIASSLRKAMRIELLEPADPPYVAEALATQLLIRCRDKRILGSDGSIHFIAGFRLALNLCCRVLADPFHAHPRAVQREVELVNLWLNDAKVLRT